MALIIKADMPTCCDKCFFNLRCPAYARQVQKIWESKHEQVFDVFGEMRLTDCPLVEIPNEHGELIDRDFLLKYAVRLERKDGCDLIPVSELENAPTVVEATEAQTAPPTPIKREHCRYYAFLATAICGDHEYCQKKETYNFECSKVCAYRELAVEATT